MCRPGFCFILISIFISCNTANSNKELIGRWQYWKSTNLEGKENINFIPDTIILEFRRDGTGIEQFRYSLSSETTWNFRDTTLQFSYSFKDSKLKTSGLNGFGNGSIEFLDGDVCVLNTGRALYWFKRLENRP